MTPDRFSRIFAREEKGGEAKGALSYRQLHAATIAKLKRGYDQVPQLEGRRTRFDQPFLSPLE